MIALRLYEMMGILYEISLVEYIRIIVGMTECTIPTKPLIFLHYSNKLNNVVVA